MFNDKVNEADDRQFIRKNNFYDSISGIQGGWMTTMAYITGADLYDGKRFMDQERFNNATSGEPDDTVRNQEWHKQLSSFMGDEKMKTMKSFYKKNGYDDASEKIRGFICVTYYQHIPWSTAKSFSDKNKDYYAKRGEIISNAEDEFMSGMGDDIKMKNLMIKLGKFRKEEEVINYVKKHLPDMANDPEQMHDLLNQWAGARDEFKQKYGDRASHTGFDKGKVLVGNTENTKDRAYIRQNMYGIKPEDKKRQYFVVYTTGRVEGPISKEYVSSLTAKRSYSATLNDLKRSIDKNDAEMNAKLAELEQRVNQDIRNTTKFIPREFNINNIMYIVGSSKGEDGNDKFAYFNEEFNGNIITFGGNEMYIDPEQIKGIVENGLNSVTKMNVSQLVQDANIENMTESVKRYRKSITESLRHVKVYNNLMKESRTRELIKEEVRRQLKQRHLI